MRLVAAVLLLSLGCETARNDPPTIDETVQIDIHAADSSVRYFETLKAADAGPIGGAILDAKIEARKLIDYRNQLMTLVDDAERGLPGLDPATGRRVSPHHVKCRFEAVNEGLEEAQFETDRLLKAAATLRREISKRGEITGLDMFRHRTSSPEAASLHKQFEESKAKISLWVAIAIYKSCP